MASLMKIQVHFLNQRYKLVVMVIVEPKINGRRADDQIGKLGFSGHYRVKSDGFSGGIWLLKHHNLVWVFMLSKHFQCLHVQLSFTNGKSWVRGVWYPR